MWDYDAGHSKLLLRGFPDIEAEFSEQPPVLDIVFSGVLHLSMQPFYPRLRLTRAEGLIGVDDA